MPARILNREALLSDVAGAARSRRALALDLADVALAAADPADATEGAVRSLRIQPASVLAVGKASAAMVEGARRVHDLPRGLILGGTAPGLRALPFDHPTPHDEAPRAAAEIAALRGPVLLLLSGGASSMLCEPAAGLTIADLQAAWKTLVDSGLSIGPINALRSALDQLKGGGLARRLPPGSACVVLSDVPGHGPEVVGSGPCSPSPTQLPPPPPGLSDPVRAALRSWTPPPPPPPMPLVVAADNASVRRALADAARARGLDVDERPAPFAGEAREAGRRFAAGERARIAGGETTVTLAPEPGRGGRNQEFALGAQRGLVLALATDGADGTSGSAGGLVDDRVRAHPGLAEHLSRSDVDTFLRAAGGRLETGRTGTNVADLAIYLP